MKTMKSIYALPFWLLCLCSVLLMPLAACSDDDHKGPGDDGGQDGSALTVYQQLQSAADKSLTVENIVSSDLFTVLTLSDNSQIELQKRHNVVNLESEDSKATFSLVKGPKNTWVLGGKDLQIPVVSTQSDNPTIVCVTYDLNIVTVYLNDGNKLFLTRSGEEGIFSFVLEAVNNKELDEDIMAVIRGTSAYIILPEGASSQSLILTFGFRGASVNINGVPQESGVTVNDFTTPLVYSLVKQDGSQIDYTVTVQSMRIPKIYIDTENQAPILDKENYVRSTIKIEDPDKLYTDGTAFEGTAGIRGRGNSTWGMPKKPYRIKLDEKAKLLGMSTDKDWALLANYADKTLLRNVTAFEISRIVDMKWTPKSVSVELYLNGEYQGVYCLTEHVKVSSERLDIDLVDETDISGEALKGDYFMELDFHFDEGARFKTDLKELPMMFKDPDEPTPEQFDYVKNYYNTAEAVLYSDYFLDSETGYRNYIDVESFIKYYIVQELSKNCDGNMRGSCYMSLTKSGKIDQPLVWDFDIAFGNANHITTEQGASSTGPEGWYIKTCSPWFDRLFEDPQFVEELKAKWNEVKPQLDLLPQFIQDHANQLKYASKRNFASKEAGGAGWDIHEIMWPNYVDRGSYDNEIKFLKDFVVKRLAWLDQNINSL